MLTSPAHNLFFGLTLAKHIWHIGVSPWDEIVGNIHDPDTTLNFDLKVKFIEFLTCFRVSTITNFWFDNGLPYLAHKSFTLRRCDTYIHVPVSYWPHSNVLAFVMSLCPNCNFCTCNGLLWHWHTIFGTWVYHHERMCQVHYWSWYDIDLWPQGQIHWVYDKALCSALSFFVLWHSHTLFGTWVYHHGTMCRIHLWTLNDFDLWPQYMNYIFTLDLS